VLGPSKASRGKGSLPSGTAPHSLPSLGEEADLGGLDLELWLSLDIRRVDREVDDVLRCADQHHLTLSKEVQA
jgi:hypothetical protein